MRNVIQLRVPKRKTLLLIVLVFVLCYFVSLHMGGQADIFPTTLQKSSPKPTQTFREKLHDVLDITEKDSNCFEIISSNEETFRSLPNLTGFRNKDPHLTQIDYVSLCTDCASFIKSHKYITFPITCEQRNFPIAYIILIHHKIEMFERCLRTIYVPQNVYCVHVDRKSPEPFHSAVAAVGSCFDNAFITSRLESVVYGSFSRLQADINCMGDLVRSTSPWTYLINHADRIYRSKLMQKSSKNSFLSKKRWQYRYRAGSVVWSTGQLKEQLTNITVFAGNSYYAVTREFVNHVLRSPEIQQFLKWSEDTYTPDENIWATIHRMPGVPGSSHFSGTSGPPNIPDVPRLIKWKVQERVGKSGGSYSPCAGIQRHGICVNAAGDLHWILQHQHHLFANKFDAAVDNTAVKCIEEYLREKVINGTSSYPAKKRKRGWITPPVVLSEQRDETSQNASPHSLLQAKC